MKDLRDAQAYLDKVMPYEPCKREELVCQKGGGDVCPIHPKGVREQGHPESERAEQALDEAEASPFGPPRA